MIYFLNIYIYIYIYIYTYIIVFYLPYYCNMRYAVLSFDEIKIHYYYYYYYYYYYLSVVSLIAFGRNLKCT